MPLKGPPSLQSSGYQSDDCHDMREHYVIEDSRFKDLEPRDYMMKLILPLSEYMAGCYKQFSR